MKHSDAGSPLDNWYRIATKAEWKSLAETRTDFPHADLVGRRTVFNVAGNKYRLVARINYRARKVFVLFVLTHAEYHKGGWKK